MTNTLAVCLYSLAFFCCADLSFARQISKECTKGPEYWCKNLRNAADCGAVGHCTATEWQISAAPLRAGETADKFVKLFRELKDVRELINEEYISSRVNSICLELRAPAAWRVCRGNTAHLESYLKALLDSATTPETMCRLIEMCDNEKLENAEALHMIEKKVEPEPKKDFAKKEPKQKPQELLGSERCTWGPSYWCTNITTGHECKATRHCIERVWSKAVYPEDTDSICKICTDMVKQARDQLTSNETQEELKEVFEGSCDLIRIKLVRSECIRLADEFVPDLIETLASQMNPQAVCSVAGLCNNKDIDKLLEGYSAAEMEWSGCNSCHQTVGALRRKFDATSYEDFLLSLLQVCRKAGSLSDSCSMLVFKYYESIVALLRHDLRPASVCHVSGQCAHRFHDHDLYTFPKADAQLTDDVPCEFCEQLVVHLRDVLVANTTEMQFYKMLKGLCKQSGTFKSECLSLVEQYYPMVYNYLASGLKPRELCALAGICGKVAAEPIAPLLPRELAVQAITPNEQLIGTDEANSYKTHDAPPPASAAPPPPPALPLPIERMFVSLPENKAACSFCQYFLHYLQVELSDTKNEDTIREAVDKACDRLPHSVGAECRQFVTEYGPAVIALLVHEIDPATVCPMIGLCSAAPPAVRHVSVNADKSNCPLCLFAVEQLETMLQNNRTETSIRQALKSLCTHLSSKLQTECTDFVDQYSAQLIDMLVADMNAQEVCVYLKLCTDTLQDPLNLKGSRSPSAIDKFFEKPQLRQDRNNLRRPMLPARMLHGAAGDIETNEIPDHTVNGRPVGQKSVCVLCEFVLKQIDDEIKDKNNEDHIKKIVHGVCKRMPKSVRAECDQFVEKYADLVISLLSQELNPDQVCQELKLCDPVAPVSAQGLTQVKEAVLDCAVCETVVVAVKKVLANDRLDHNIVHVVEKSCALLPAQYYERCHTLLEIYGDSIIHLVEDLGTKGVCEKIGLCVARVGTYVHMHRGGQ